MIKRASAAPRGPEAADGVRGVVEVDGAGRGIDRADRRRCRHRLWLLRPFRVDDHHPGCDDRLQIGVAETGDPGDAHRRAHGALVQILDLHVWPPNARSPVERVRARACRAWFAGSLPAAPGTVNAPNRAIAKPLSRSVLRARYSAPSGAALPSTPMSIGCCTGSSALRRSSRARRFSIPSTQSGTKATRSRRHCRPRRVSGDPAAEGGVAGEVAHPLLLLRAPARRRP